MALFEKNCSHFFLYPFRVAFVKVDATDNAALQILISVPKKSFKKAIHRNRIKRRIRELFRLNKNTIESLLEAKNESYALHILYVSKEEIPYENMEQAWLKLTNKMHEKWN